MTHRPMIAGYNGVVRMIKALWRRAAPPAGLLLAGERLTGWLPEFRDLGLALGLLVIDVVQTGSGPAPARVLLAPLATLPLAYRRRWPLPVFGLVLLGAILTASSASFAAPLTAIMVATYSVGGYSRARRAALAILLATATAILLAFGGQVPGPPDVLVPYLILGVPWLVGNAIRDQRRLAALFRDKAARLEREQAATTQTALAEERARLARELHDIVAHSVSVMVVQAGAARHVLQVAPEQASDALQAVETTGREALTELRHLLGLLALEESGPGLAPPAGLDQLASLLHRVQEAGLPVALQITGQPRPLPPGLDLTAYRVVQEALTNALKYAGQAHTAVVLAYREDELHIEVLDAGPGGATRVLGATGRGLVGMRERVALYGGRLEAGPQPGQGYALRVWLPLGSRRP